MLYALPRRSRRFCNFALSAAALGAGACLLPCIANAEDEPRGTLESIEVTARHLNEARASIETQLGASVYTLDAAAIAAMPGGDNTLLSQALLQAPDIAQDSFGQLHVRGEHNGLQYRLNGIILPEGIGGFGQSFDPRLLSSVQLLTGALPAEYGLRTAGIIDLTTKSGAVEPGGEVAIYGGSHRTLQPSVHFAGSHNGATSWFASVHALQNGLGIESPDGSANPVHDRTRQVHAFGYLEHILDSANRVSLLAGAFEGTFQIPDRRDASPDPDWQLAGVASLPITALDERQREATEFAIASFQHSGSDIDWQTSLVVRGSSLTYTPDAAGDLIYDGISQWAGKRNDSVGWQADGSRKLREDHILRAGWYLQQDHTKSSTRSLVFPVDATGAQASTTPFAIDDGSSRSEWLGSAYLQDEWHWTPSLTLNYGLRFDHYSAFSSGTQWSPRANLVWTAQPGTTVHAGYARYFSPPPFELVGSETIARFQGTSAAPETARADTPAAERAHYFDIGVLRTVHQALSLGLDTWYKVSRNLLDEGQFGAPIVLTPFNYREGRQYGAETTFNYTGELFTAYANIAWQRALGRDIVSSQFNFSPADLAYIAANVIPLDHEQRWTASGGGTWKVAGANFSADFLLGSGMRADLVLASGGDIPNGRRLPYYTQVNLAASREFAITGGGSATVRIDVINLLDRIYEIRDGTGVGVGAPQYGARRGIFLGLSRAF
jgi:outer membrane receptor protein involved in Fe transport